MDDAQSTERMLRQDLTKAKHMIATKESELRDEIIDLQNEHEEQLRGRCILCAQWSMRFLLQFLDSACRLSDTTKQLNELTEYRDILASKLDVSEKIFDTAQAQMQVVVEERNMRDKEIRALKVMVIVFYRSV